MSNFSMEKFHTKKNASSETGHGKSANSEWAVHARRDRARERKSEEDGT